MNRNQQTILLGAILLLAAGLRLAGLERTSLWVDEGYSVALSSLSPGEIVAGTAAAQHPPLYYLLLHGWMGLVGRSVLANRLFSALVGWVTVPLAYHIGRRFGMKVALAAAGLLAVSPAHVWYSQEARMYALLVLLGTLSSWLAWRWWTDSAARTWSRSLLYAAVTLAALYTHNFAVFLIAAQNLAALFLGWLPAKASPAGGDRRRLALRWCATQSLWVIGYLPWVPTLVLQVTQHRMTWIAPASWPAVRNTWLYLLYGATWQGRWYDVAGAVLGLGLVVLALWPTRPAPAGQARKRGWVALWFWAPTLIIIGAARRLLIYQDKQLLIVLPPLILLLAIGLWRLDRRPWPALGLVAILALLAGPLKSQYTTAQKQDWRGLAAYVDAHAQPGDLVYFNPHAGKLTFNYYTKSGLPQAGYPPDYTLVRGGWEGEPATAPVVNAQIDLLAQRYSRVWLVDFFPEFWDPRGLIVGRLQQTYKVAETSDWNGVRLVLFCRGTGP